MATNPNMVAIQTVTVGSGGASSITFSNIPQTYTDLVLFSSARTNRAGITIGGLQIAPNNSTANQTSINLGTSGSGTFSGTDTIIYAIAEGDGGTASIFANSMVYIPNYAGSANKTLSTDAVTENNGSANYCIFYANLWSNTSAITSLVLTPLDASSILQYSTFYLYGITSSAYGAKATGGIITSDANYYYHTFLASGTFTPTSNITADYLVVAGGGGTTQDYSSGGGAGGVRCTVQATGGGGSLPPQASFTNGTVYTITIGAGGGATTSNNGTQGSSSSIAGSGLTTISTTGGGGGAKLNITGGNGGSGGGGGGSTSSGPTYAGGTPTSGEGYAGGTGIWGNILNDFPTGGGGGAGAVGATGVSGQSGAGGAGITTNISGSSVTYGGGGGGGGYNGGSSLPTLGGAGGTGGGGAGSTGSGSSGTAGTANTGGGGGGSSGAQGAGVNGGSGIVIVRYAK